MSATTTTGTETWTIDPSHSAVEFSVKHMMFATVRGRFSKFSGTITVPNGDPTQATIDVSIDADSIDTRDEKRDEHLRSNDFFGAGDNPQITFRSTSVRDKGGDRFEVTGDLTIRGVTKQVVLDATFNGQGVNPWGATVAGWSAKTEVDRKEFGVNWNAALESGGFLVGDDVKIQLDVEASRQA